MLSLTSLTALGTTLVSWMKSLWNTFKLEIGAYLGWLKGKADGLLEGDLKTSLKTIIIQEKALELRNEYEKIDTAPRSDNPNDILNRLRD